MVDIAVKFTNINVKDVEDIVERCENLSATASINITQPWPKMKFGDRFVYGGVEYAFLTYASKYKVRAVTVDALENDSAIQPTYFDCSKKQSNMRFIIR